GRRRLRPLTRRRRGSSAGRRGRRPRPRAAGRDPGGHVDPGGHRGGSRDPNGLKKRVDVLLVERGLAESRAQAQALVLAGLVPGYDKPGTQVDETTELTVESPPPYVSRAGHKLANALDAFGLDVAGLDAIDVGAS